MSRLYIHSSALTVTLILTGACVSTDPPLEPSLPDEQELSPTPVPVTDEMLREAGYLSKDEMPNLCTITALETRDQRDTIALEIRNRRAFDLNLHIYGDIVSETSGSHFDAGWHSIRSGDIQTLKLDLPAVTERPVRFEPGQAIYLWCRFAHHDESVTLTDDHRTTGAFVHISRTETPKSENSNWAFSEE